MANQSSGGFEEASTRYVGGSSDLPLNLVGQWRRFGPYGPRYEVISIEDERDATVRVHTSGEVTRYGIAEILADPVD